MEGLLQPKERVAEAFAGGFFQGLAVVGVGDGNQQFGALGEGFAAEVDDAVLGCDELCLEARRDDAGTGGKVRDDLALALGRAGREGDEGPAAFGEGAAVHEIVLAADAREDHVADGVGADLAGEIHLDGGIDGAGARILRDEERIVGVGDVEELHGRIVVDVSVHILRADGEGRDADAGMDFLERIVDDALLDQADHAVGHRLGVEAEVLVVLDPVEDGVGDAADADLEAGAVRNLAGDVGADGRLDGRGLAEGHRERGDVAEDRRRNLALVDEAVAVEIGDVGAHQGDDVTGHLRGGNGDVGGDAEAAVAVLVGQGAGDERHIDGEFPAAEQGRHLAEEGGGHRAVTGGHVGALVGADEDGVHEERILVLRLAEGRGILVDVESGGDGHVAEFGVTAGEGFLQKNGDGGAALAGNGVAAADELDGFVGAYIFHIQPFISSTKLARWRSSRSKSASVLRRDTHTRTPVWPEPVELRAMATMPQRRSPSRSWRLSTPG